MDKKKIEGELRSFLDFKDNWDSYQAKSFSKDLINNCIELVSILEEDLPEPHVAPYSGGIQFEWDGEREIEVTISEGDDFLDYMVIYSNGSTVESRIYKKYWENLNRLIKFCKGRENGK